LRVKPQLRLSLLLLPSRPQKIGLLPLKKAAEDKAAAAKQAADAKAAAAQQAAANKAAAQKAKQDQAAAAAKAKQDQAAAQKANAGSSCSRQSYCAGRC